jgi:hypothetical protein
MAKRLEVKPRDDIRATTPDRRGHCYSWSDQRQEVDDVVDLLGDFQAHREKPRREK